MLDQQRPSSKSDQTPLASVKAPATRKPDGALAKGFQRQAQIAQLRPPPPPLKAKVKRSFSSAPASSAPPPVPKPVEVVEIGSSSDVDEEDVTAIEGPESKSDKAPAKLRTPAKAVQPPPPALHTDTLPNAEPRRAGFRTALSAIAAPATVGVDAACESSCFCESPQFLTPIAYKLKLANSGRSDPSTRS